MHIFLSGISFELRFLRVLEKIAFLPWNAFPECLWVAQSYWGKIPIALSAYATAFSRGDEVIYKGNGGVQRGENMSISARMSPPSARRAQ